MLPDVNEMPIGLAELHKRLREAWADLHQERQRAIAERAASENFLRQHHESLVAREAALEQRRQRMAGEVERFERGIAARKKELEALDARLVSTYQALERAEKLREAKAAIPEAEAVAEEIRRATIPAPRPARVDEAIEDQRRVLAEQFAKLARAQDRWRDAECQTLDDLEDLAHVLRRRERELDERERDLLQADRRRREESYNLWQRRLQLDGWRGVITAHEAWWHTERQRQELELAENRARITRRELAVTHLLAKWSEKLRNERDRLRHEVEAWTAVRLRLDAAREAYDRKQQEALAALQGYASRSLALDETFRETLDLKENSATVRRFRLLEKRWSRTFDRRRQEIEERIEAARVERRAVDAQHRELYHRQADISEGMAKLLAEAGECDRDRFQTLPDPYARPAPVAHSEELALLRGEVERLAFALLHADWPSPESLDHDANDPQEAPRTFLRAA